MEMRELKILATGYKPLLTDFSRIALLKCQSTLRKEISKTFESYKISALCAVRHPTRTSKHPRPGNTTLSAATNWLIGFGKIQTTLLSITTNQSKSLPPDSPVSTVRILNAEAHSKAEYEYQE
jgi:hypothetical protein